MEAKYYFRSYEKYFWQWEEEGAVITIPEGPTVAYREFIISILEKLSLQGLPSLGAIILAIIATNPDGNKILNDVHRIVDKKLGYSNSTREPLQSAIEFLRMLSKIPSQYKQGTNRILLLQTLFYDCHNIIAAERAQRILDYYKTQKLQDEFTAAGTIFQLNVYNNDFKVISLLIRKFPDVETILQKMADLPLLEEEVKIEDNEEIAEKDFLDELIKNNKTFHVGSLVKRLWSGLNIPYHNYLPSQQPIGGISDLTNKGEFHRLLVSEFANDDIVLLSRLANNEALYVNREVPPQNNDLERIILIDTTIKNWGTPKTIAYALSLAIAKHPKTNIHCSAFAVGQIFYPVSFDTIEDVIAGLQVLDPALNPAQGIESFFKQHNHKRKAEIFLITSKDSYRHPALHKVVSDHYNLFNYWIQTDAEGNVDVYKRQQNSKRHLQHIQLPLAELWKKVVQRDENNSDLTNSIYPILFPVAFNRNKLLLAPTGDILLITPEKNLIRCVNKSDLHKHGWEMIMEGLPTANGEAAIGLTSNYDVLLLLFNIANRHLHLINLTTREKRSCFFHEWRNSVYKQFLFYNGLFYYSYLGYPSKHWTFEWGSNDIIVKSFENIPKEITDQHSLQEEQYKKMTASSPTRSVFKNVTSVYINQVNNIVFNIHELRLTHRGIIKLEHSGFKERVIEAEPINKNEFRFPDGSTITINRTGIIILKSSDASIETIYIPSVIDGALGIATRNMFSGYEYYFNPHCANQEKINPEKFWQEYMEPFINNIKLHGTEVKAV